MCGVGMKWWSLKAKQDSLFWSSAKHRKLFSKINDDVNSSLQKWIISHTHLIQYPILNYYIKVKFYDVNGGVNTELHHKVLLQVSFPELHKYIIKMILMVFPWYVIKKYLFVLVILIFNYFFHHNY